MDFKAFERGVWGKPLYILRKMSSVRLGYEIVKLVDDPKTRDSVKISGRENSGIGIDSNLPEPFLPKEVEKILGSKPIIGEKLTDDNMILPDYHKWSTFNKEWIAFADGSRGNDLYDKVMLLITDEQIRSQYKIINQTITNPASGEEMPAPTASPHFEHLILNRMSYIKSEDIIRAMLENPKWREEAKTYCRLFMGQKFDFFRRNEQSMLEALADQRGSHKFIETARPTINAMNELFALYARQMQQ